MSLPFPKHPAAVSQELSMSIRPTGFLDPFRWFTRALDIGSGQPLPVMTAIAVLVLVAMVPGLPVQVMQMAGQPPPLALVLGSQVLALAIAVTIVPALTGGVYRVFRRSERGEPAHGGQVMEAFRDGSALSLVLVNLLLIGLNLILVLLMVGTIAVLLADQFPALVAWVPEIVAWQQKVGADPAAAGAAMPPMPGADGVAILATVGGVALAFTPLLLLVAVGGGLAIADVALRGTSPVSALRRGLGAAFLGAPGWLAFFLVLIIVGGLALMLIAVILTMVIGLLAAVSPLLAALIGVPVYLVAMLVGYALGLGTLYHAWRETLDDDTAPAGDAASGSFAA